MFQSRNRDTFDFKKTAAKKLGLEFNTAFQSRNRDTFDFKARSPAITSDSPKLVSIS